MKYCFTTATLVTGTPVIVALYLHCLAYQLAVTGLILQSLHRTAVRVSSFQ